MANETDYLGATSSACSSACCLLFLVVIVILLWKALSPRISGGRVQPRTPSQYPQYGQPQYPQYGQPPWQPPAQNPYKPQSYYYYPPPGQTQQPTKIILEKQVVQVVKVRCPYCKSLYDETHSQCPNCGGGR